MSTNIKNAKSGTSFPPMEAGTYAAVCCAVVDLGLQKTMYDGKEREVFQILIMWEFPEELIEVDGEMKPRWLSRRYTFSISEKSNLRKDLKSWRGRDFTDKELIDFDIKNVIGAPCLITVSQEEKNGSVYSNISSVGKLMKGMTVGEPSKTYHFDIDDKATWKAFPDMPEWIRNKINDSLTLARQGIQINDDGTVFENGLPASSSDSGFVPIEEDVNEDDLPF